MQTGKMYVTSIICFKVLGTKSVTDEKSVGYPHVFTLRCENVSLVIYHRKGKLNIYEVISDKFNTFWIWESLLRQTCDRYTGQNLYESEYFCWCSECLWKRRSTWVPVKTLVLYSRTSLVNSMSVSLPKPYISLQLDRHLMGNVNVLPPLHSSLNSET